MLLQKETARATRACRFWNHTGQGQYCINTQIWPSRMAADLLPQPWTSTPAIMAPALSASCLSWGILWKPIIADTSSSEPVGTWLAPREVSSAGWKIKRTVPPQISFHSLEQPAAPGYSENHIRKACMTLRIPDWHKADLSAPNGQSTIIASPQGNNRFARANLGN